MMLTNALPMKGLTSFEQDLSLEALESGESAMTLVNPESHRADV